MYKEIKQIKIPQITKMLLLREEKPDLRPIRLKALARRITILMMKFPVVLFRDNRERLATLVVIIPPSGFYVYY
jgi:hypothetical protein